ncbi:hypothetical protein BJ322DRAFT_1103194 [Thelephora terrestris]|uniref:EF-hand domain-containing protein n=1 Tax=Thelephora terrestris TaxID=56493 RepID=A0A9P6LCG6_9AGAM|nr:hypothetical protein BJ322DRAFT_1103194 [Thelephora terrestris]
MRQDLERVQSPGPRPNTPELGARQGHRNAGAAQLLTSDGSISDEFERCLKHIFAKYCTSPPPDGPNGKRYVFLSPPEGAYLSSEGLDAWATDTNGTPFSEDTKKELREFMDVTDTGCLTFKGFLQIYQLQTENDEEETWRDLSQHGFDRNLRLVSSRREDADGDADPLVSAHPSPEKNRAAIKTDNNANPS